MKIGSELWIFLSPLVLVGTREWDIRSHRLQANQVSSIQQMKNEFFKNFSSSGKLKFKS